MDICVSFNPFCPSHSPFHQPSLASRHERGWASEKFVKPFSLFDFCAESFFLLFSRREKKEKANPPSEHKK
jgi:hypothetical protein